MGEEELVAVKANQGLHGAYTNSKPWHACSSPEKGMVRREREVVCPGAVNPPPSGHHGRAKDPIWESSASLSPCPTPARSRTLMCLELQEGKGNTFIGEAPGTLCLLMAADQSQEVPALTPS